MDGDSQGENQLYLPVSIEVAACVLARQLWPEDSLQCGMARVTYEDALSDFFGKQLISWNELREYIYLQGLDRYMNL